MRLIRILIPFSILLLCNFWGCPKDGTQGSQGEQGIQGVQGEKGDKGDKGDQGSAGLGALHAIDNDNTDIGFVLDYESPLIKIWIPSLQDTRWINKNTGFDVATGTNIKIYFPTDDCSGPPYTYAPLTQSDTIYQTNYNGGQNLKTTSVEVNLYIAKVVHAGTDVCVAEGASYDLREAAWYPETPLPDYAPPITIEAR